MATATLTTLGLAQRVELEAVRDQICGMYGQDLYLIHELSHAQKKQLTRHLDRVLEEFDGWATKYDFKLP